MLKYPTFGAALLTFSVSVQAGDYVEFDPTKEDRLIAHSVDTRIAFRVEVCAPKNAPLILWIHDGSQFKDAVIAEAQCPEFVGFNFTVKRIVDIGGLHGREKTAPARYRIIETVKMNAN